MKTSREIIDQCFPGGKISRKNITGTVIRAYVISPFACFCQFKVDPKEKDAVTRFGKLLATWGNELEHQYVDNLDARAREKQFSYDSAGFETFVEAAFAGEKYIHNPPLFFLPENLAGKPDLLVRDDSAPSVFGNHHYRITEIKFSSHFGEPNKRHYLMQGLFYNHLLSLVQEYLPPRFTMVDRHGTSTEFEYAKYAGELVGILREIDAIRSGQTRPEPVYNSCGGAYWEKYCNAQAEVARDISLVPNLKGRIRGQMAAKGVKTIDQLSQLNVNDISAFKWVGKRGGFFSQQAKCLVSGKEIIVQRVTCTPRRVAEVYVDVEDTAYVHPTIPHFVFLVGLAVRTVGDPEYHTFIAKSEKEVPEKTKEFLSFLDKLGDYQVYCWSKKEAGEFQKIFTTYNIRGPVVDCFNNRMVDLSRTLEGRVYLPVRTYSVKEVAQYLGYKWQDQEVDAMEAVALFFEYLESGHQESLEKVLDYNRDDCLAMITIKDWLVANAVM